MILEMTSLISKPTFV